MGLQKNIDQSRGGNSGSSAITNNKDLLGVAARARESLKEIEANEVRQADLIRKSNTLVVPIGVKIKFVLEDLVRMEQDLGGMICTCGDPNCSIGPFVHS